MPGTFPPSEPVAEGPLAGISLGDTLGQGPRVSQDWPDRANRRPGDATNKVNILLVFVGRSPVGVRGLNGARASASPRSMPTYGPSATTSGVGRGLPDLGQPCPPAVHPPYRPSVPAVHRPYYPPYTTDWSIRGSIRTQPGPTD